MSFELSKMSDEEILKFDISTFDKEDTEETTDEVEEESDTTDSEGTETLTESSVEEIEEDNNNNNNEEEKSSDSSNTTEESEESNTLSDIDKNIITEVNKLFTNGLKVGTSTIKVNSIDELTTLLQRGIGANKRMQELKPKLKMLSALEDNGLATQDNLNFAVELLQKNPKAIAKLIKEANIDTLDLDTDIEYTPNDYSISDERYELQETLAVLQNRDKYSDAVTFIKGLDTKSKNLVGTKPSIIGSVINDMETEYNGEPVFDQIKSIVESEQLKGRYSNMGFLEAYEAVVQVLRENLAGNVSEQEAGHSKNFTSYFTVTRNTVSPHKVDSFAQNNRKGSTASKPNTVNTNSDNNAIKAAKKAAKTGSVGNTPTNQNKSILDISKMTDEEILKLPLDFFDK